VLFAASFEFIESAQFVGSVGFIGFVGLVEFIGSSGLSVRWCVSLLVGQRASSLKLGSQYVSWSVGLLGRLGLLSLLGWLSLLGRLVCRFVSSLVRQFDDSLVSWFGLSSLLSSLGLLSLLSSLGLLISHGSSVR